MDACPPPPRCLRSRQLTLFVRFPDSCLRGRFTVFNTSFRDLVVATQRRNINVNRPCDCRETNEPAFNQVERFHVSMVSVDFDSRLRTYP